MFERVNSVVFNWELFASSLGDNVVLNGKNEKTLSHFHQIRMMIVLTVL